MIIAVVALLLLLGWLFLGVYEEREFSTHHLFLKHRPAWKFFFKAPMGEGDARQLSAADAYEEKMYSKFVEEGNGYKRAIWLGR